MEVKMKVKSFLWGLLVILTVSSGHTLFAQGESAVPFLLIAPGARAGGMGEAGVALATDATAIFWNPAGLAFQFEDPEVDYRGEASFMHVNWLPQFNFSDLFYDFLAARYYVDEIDGMVGFGLTYLNLGENVWTDEQGNEKGTFDSKEYAVTLGYATKLEDNLGLGLNLKLIRSELVPSNVTVGAENRGGNATSFAVDVGVLWTPAYEFLENRLNVGANLANFGPEVTYINEDQADPLPTNLRLGFAYKVLDDEFNRITIVYDANRELVYRTPSDTTKDIQPDGVFKAVFYSSWVKGSISERLNKFTHSLGLEYWYGNLIALRAGYFYEHPDYGDRNFLTFGGGIKYDIFGIDFGYISAEEDHPLSDTMRFSVSVQF
jgi:type IX secretion system protein PorV